MERNYRARRPLSRRRWIPLVGAAAFLLTTISVATAATTIDDLFELEGNPEADGVFDDWETLQAGPPAPGTGFVASTAIPIFDDQGDGDTSYFHKGGSKDTNDINMWAHRDQDVAPDKDEIINAAASAYRNADGELVLFFTADRFDGSGDAAIGFWFFKNQISLNPDGTFSGVHANGDVLITSDFSGGGTISTIRVFEWQSGTLQETALGGDPLDCDASGHNSNICATVNDATNNAIPTSAIWPYTDKDGFTDYQAGAFYEGGINVTELLLGPDPTPEEECFASFLAESRSSTSPTAQLKDFVLGSFPVCAPSTTLTASATAQALPGTDATFTIAETNDGDSALTNPHVTSDNTDCGTLSTAVSKNLNTDDDLDVDETWTFECTVTVPSAMAGDLTINFVGHGTDFLGRDVTWHDDCTSDGEAIDTDGDGTNDVLCDVDEQASATVDVIVPSTDLDMAASATTIKSGDTVTLTFSEENDATEGSLSAPGVLTDHADCDEPSEVTFTGGDDNSNTELDPGETWTFECDVSIDDDTTITATATGTILGHEVTWVDGCTATGDLVDSDDDSTTDVFCDNDEQTTLDIDVIFPSTKLLKRASAVVTYTYLETNDGDSDITNVSVSDDTCAPVTEVDENNDGFNDGDLNKDGVLNPGETWKFTCTTTIDAPSGDGGEADGSNETSKPNTATASGTDETGDTVTHCDDPEHPPADTECDQDERDSATVTITHHDNPS